LPPPRPRLRLFVEAHTTSDDVKLSRRRAAAAAAAVEARLAELDDAELSGMSEVWGVEFVTDGGGAWGSLGGAGTDIYGTDGLVTAVGEAGDVPLPGVEEMGWVEFRLVVRGVGSEVQAAAAEEEEQEEDTEEQEEEEEEEEEGVTRAKEDVAAAAEAEVATAIAAESAHARAAAARPAAADDMRAALADASDRVASADRALCAAKGKGIDR